MISPILGSVFWDLDSPPLGYFERDSHGTWRIIINDSGFHAELNMAYRDLETNGTAYGGNPKHLRYLLSYIQDIPVDDNKSGVKSKGASEPEEEILGWVTYNSDWSDMVTFKTEIDCLRYAVRHNMDSVDPILNANSIRLGRKYMDVNET